MKQILQYQMAKEGSRAGSLYLRLAGLGWPVFEKVFHSGHRIQRVMGPVAIDLLGANGTARKQWEFPRERGAATTVLQRTAGTSQLLDLTGASIFSPFTGP